VNGTKVSNRFARVKINTTKLSKMKKKFKLSTKIGQRVSKIEINIRADNGKYGSETLYKEGVFVKDHKIVFQTPRRIALNDSYITTFDRQEEGERHDTYNHHIEYPSISVKTTEICFPNGIFATMYTIGDVNKAIKKLTKDIHIKIKKEYGFLSNIDVFGFVEQHCNQESK
jgi:hypothetical protein